jgi:hypothetical protein
MSTTDTDQLEAQLRRQWSIPAGKSPRPLWPKENRAVQVQVEHKNRRRLARQREEQPPVKECATGLRSPR